MPTVHGKWWPEELPEKGVTIIRWPSGHTTRVEHEGRETMPDTPDEFRVHRSAATKTTAKTTRSRKKQPPQPPPEPVKVTQVHPKALEVARDLAGHRDVHLVFNQDGSVEIRNGHKE